MKHVTLATILILVITVLVACQKADTSTGHGATAKAAVAAYTLDEAKLPPVNRFTLSDLGPADGACTDFAAYVNGKWLAAHDIPADRATWGATDMLVERSLAVRHQLAEQAAAKSDATGIDKIIGDFYATGMDQAKIDAQGIAPLQGRLDAIDAIADRGELAGYLRTSAARGENPLFSFLAAPDFKDSSMVIAYAGQGGLGLPDRGYYFDVDKKGKLDAYRKHIAKVLELSGVSAADAAIQADAVIAFETRLAKVSKSSEEISLDVSLYYNPVSPVEADKLTPNFPWTTFFQSQSLAVPAMFSLAIPGFHKEVDAMLADVPLDNWKAYLRYHAVDEASPYLGEPFALENHEFHSKVMRGQKEQKARWKRVLGAIEDGAGEAMGQLYVKVAFPPESKARMEAVVQNLRTSLKARIEQLDWMGAGTKAKAIEKWKAFTPKIGYPDTWRDWSGLHTSRESYLGNVLAAREFNYQWDLGRIGKPVDRSLWGVTPQTVNAYYWPLGNEIVFPAAILQPPVFDPEADDALNYGAIGAVIGHEMIHGYDNRGSRFGPTGNFENWWTDADSAKFAARTGKLVEQFDAYEALPGLKVNGKLTLGENIADLGGLATAWDAMKVATTGTPDPMIDDLTRDQRFFIGYAVYFRDKWTPDFMKMIANSNPHAPSEFRTNGAVSNMPVFAAAFRCKAGDAMVRPDDKRVAIW